MEIKLPFLKQQAGLGDVVKAATTAIGIKPCGGCQKRAETLNRALQFKPRASAPPPIPEIPKTVAGVSTASVPIVGARSMNAYANPKPSNRWTAPPDIPDGWVRIDTREVWDGPVMFKGTRGEILIWRIVKGEYKQSQFFAPSCSGQADAAWRYLIQNA